MKKLIKKHSLVLFIVSMCLIGLLLDFLLIKLGVPEDIVYFERNSRAKRHRRSGGYGFVIVLCITIFCLFEYHFYLRKFKPEKLLNPSVTKEDLKTSRTHDIISQIVMFSLLIPVFFLIKSIIKYL